MATLWQRTRIDIPDGYGRPDRLSIAQDVIDFIVERSQRGLDKDNNKFPGYTAEYRSSFEYQVAGKGGVDLTLTGEMLNSMELISHGKGFITIGFQAGSEVNAKADGNIRGTYGTSTPNSAKARDFLGIKQSDLANILSRYPIEPGQPTSQLAISRGGIDLDTIRRLREGLLGISIFQRDQ